MNRTKINRDNIRGKKVICNVINHHWFNCFSLNSEFRDGLFKKLGPFSKAKQFFVKNPQKLHKKFTKNNKIKLIKS